MEKVVDLFVPGGDNINPGDLRPILVKRTRNVDNRRLSNWMVLADLNLLQGYACMPHVGGFIVFLIRNLKICANVIKVELVIVG